MATWLVSVRLQLFLVLRTWGLATPLPPLSVAQAKEQLPTIAKDGFQFHDVLLLAGFPWSLHVHCVLSPLLPWLKPRWRTDRAKFLQQKVLTGEEERVSWEVQLMT